jgi:hypothetical protein
LLIAAGLVFLGALLFAVSACQVALGSGSKRLPVPIEIYDADTKKPVSGARVWLHFGEGLHDPPIGTVEQTDSNGCAQIVAELAIGSRKSLFTSRTTVALGHYMLRVEAPEYQASNVLTREYWGSGVDFRNLPIPPAKVYLKRREGAAD